MPIYKDVFIKLFWLAGFWWVWTSPTLSNQEDIAMLTCKWTYTMVTAHVNTYIGYVNFWYLQRHMSPPYPSMPHNSWSMEETKHRSCLSHGKHEWWEVEQAHYFIITRPYWEQHLQQEGAVRSHLKGWWGWFLGFSPCQHEPVCVRLWFGFSVPSFVSVSSQCISLVWS